MDFKNNIVKTLNEEILKIKHLFKFKKGDRLVMENVDKQNSKVLPLCSELEGVKELVPIFPEYGVYGARIPGKGLPKCLKTKRDQKNWEVNKNKTYKQTPLSNQKSEITGTLPGANACEIQKFLEQNGFLEKGSYEYCKFHDTSAKALGDYIERKTGIYLGIENLKELQEYMKLIGFDTGSYGFGPIMAEKVSELIDFLENLKGNILNNEKFFDFIREATNKHLISLNDTQFDTIKEYREDEVAYLDLDIYHPLHLENIKISKLDRKTISLYGEVAGTLYLDLGGGFWTDSEYMTYAFTVDIDYEFSFGGLSGLCVNFTFKNGKVNSKGKAMGIDWTWWTVYVEDNNVAINKGKFLGNTAGIDYVYYIDLDRILSNELKSLCLPTESIIKLIKGVTTPKDVLDKVKFNKPKEKLELRWAYSDGLRKKDVPGKLPEPTNYDKISRDAGGGGLYHPGKI